jgi:glyoxylase-like metal-dependent hydrolase (beta-lactamase superfamily II)
MHIEQIYTGCLAQGAYYIESNGEAVVIDPLRETTPYTERAKKSGAKIKYVFETHFHADFVSGHIDLAKETGTGRRASSYDILGREVGSRNLSKTDQPHSEASRFRFGVRWSVRCHAEHSIGGTYDRDRCR